MPAMVDFKTPESLLQDLLLINDLVGLPDPAPSLPLPLNASKGVADFPIDSSDSENGSEDEIEADLIKTEDDELAALPSRIPSDSNSDSDSDSDSDSEQSEPEKRPGNPKLEHDVDDDEDSGLVAATGTYFQTKNETAEANITVPDIEEVGSEEVLEKVGYITTIIDKTVIVKGIPSDVLERGSEKALDSETLLVFDDRKVMGYIYETFGPTSQPLYQIKFTDSYPLDAEKVWLDREVYHVPQRSHFVFLREIKRLKGSDASNVHDEEPGEDELEFSDDEAEAAYRSHLKRKRGESRANSVMSFRHATPIPSQMRDQDLKNEDYPLAGNPYDEHGPYDMDYNAGPSRPAPIPYDDPYSAEYNTDSLIAELTAPSSHVSSIHHESSTSQSRGSEERRDHGRGRGRGGDNHTQRGSARGRGRVHPSHRGRGDRGRKQHGARQESGSGGVSWGSRPPQDVAHVPRPLSPTSLAIARATGQYPAGFSFNTSQPLPTSAPNGNWVYPQHAQHDYGFASQPYVQPHINPRFASAFGMHMGFSPPPPYPPYDPRSQQSPRMDTNWTDQWTVHGNNSSEDAGGGT